MKRKNKPREDVIKGLTGLFVRNVAVDYFTGWVACLINTESGDGATWKKPVCKTTQAWHKQNKRMLQYNCKHDALERWFTMEFNWDESQQLFAELVSIIAGSWTFFISNIYPFNRVSSPLTNYETQKIPKSIFTDIWCCYRSTSIIS